MLLKLTAIAIIGLGVSAAVAAPRTINSCTNITQPGSYIVSRNINATAGPGDCMRILAPHVTLDLNGMVVAGPGAVGGVAAGDGIVVSGDAFSVSIVNGSVTGFRHGVSVLIPVSGVSIERVRVTDNAMNGVSGFGDVLLNRNYAAGNGENGFKFGRGSTVVHNFANDNGDYGFDGACDATLAYNSAYGNGIGAYLMFDDGSPTCVIDGNSG